MKKLLKAPPSTMAKVEIIVRLQIFVKFFEENVILLKHIVKPTIVEHGSFELLNMEVAKVGLLPFCMQDGSAGGGRQW